MSEWIAKEEFFYVEEVPIFLEFTLVLRSLILILNGVKNLIFLDTSI